MFTGLVEARATVRQLQRGAAGARLLLEVGFEQLALGESISVNGACLTVSRCVEHGFWADVSAETLRVTTLGALQIGQRVNVERAMTLGGRLGGHLVMGHVDAVGVVRAVVTVGEARRVTVQAPSELRRYLAPKGSVALDGVSLTINALSAPDSLEVMVVPHTLAETTLAALRGGERLNIEVDVLARYAARLMEEAGLLSATESASGESATLLSALQRGGYV